MTRVVVWVLAAVGLACASVTYGASPAAPATTAAASSSNLDAQIQAVLADKLLARATVGIEFVRLGDSPASSKVVYEFNSHGRFTPASNLKVVTTSAALDGLGADFRFRTLLVQRGEDLVLIGDGDPTLGDAEMLRKFGWEPTTVFKNWATALAKRGMTHVNNVIVDDSVFEENGIHPRWPIDQMQLRYCAETGGVNLNTNCVDFFLATTGAGNVVNYRTSPPTDYLTVRNRCISGGENAIQLTRRSTSNVVDLSGTCPQSSGVPVSVTVHDPAMFAVTVLAEQLKAAGIRVNGSVTRDRTIRATLEKTPASTQAAEVHPAVAAATAPTTQQATTASATVPPTVPAWQLLAVHETPIMQVIARANKDSVNLYAECLGKRLGFATTGESGSWQNGPAAVGAFLRKLGVSDEEFELDDGSGMSKQNKVSPNTLVTVLSYDHFGPNQQAYFNSLSVAGVDGTLEHRFPGSDLRGRLVGKSGFVEGVSSLSGYFKGRDGKWYAFSILMNGIPRLSNSMIKPLQEAIVKAVDGAAK